MAVVPARGAAARASRRATGRRYNVLMDAEKTIQFILEKSAENTVQLQILRETAMAHEHDLQVHTEWKPEMSRALQDLAAMMKDGFRLMADKHVELAQARKDSAEEQRTTRENLNSLIRTVQDILPHLPKQ